MGRDHTIFAKEKGYVCFYKDPETHPKRKYIGVVFERGMKLPTPRNKPRIRRLGLVGREREIGTLATATPPRAEGLEVGRMTEKGGALRQQSNKTRQKAPALKMKLKPGYSYRESNRNIGRAIERAGIKVREYRKFTWDERQEWLREKKKKAMMEKTKIPLLSRKQKGSKKGAKKK